MERKEIIGQLEELLYNFENEETVDCTKDDVEALKFAIDELKVSIDNIEFKKLVLATGEEFEDGVLSCGFELTEECLPNAAIITLGKQKIVINAEFILSIEPKNIIF